MFKFCYTIILIVFVVSRLEAREVSDSAASKVVYYDYSYSGYKSIDTSMLSELRQDRDFNYKTTKPAGNNFFGWLLEKLSRIFEKVYKSKVAPIVFYIVFGALFIFLILKLFDKKIQAVFMPSVKNRIATNISDVDITNSDFEKLIADAVEAKDYQSAVRFLYLQFLNILNEKSIIIWKSDKTTFDYMSEIKPGQVSVDFMSLSAIYEYVWYGKFTISSEQFKSIRERFETTLKVLNS